MPKIVPLSRSPRCGIIFNMVPYSNADRVLGLWTQAKAIRDYGAILDCIFEMADAVSTANDISVEQAIAQVIRDEGYNVLSHDKFTIAAKLKA